MYQLRSIPPGTSRGWKVLLNGEEVTADLVEFISSRWGRVVYGFRDEGYDSWMYEVKANAVTIPYCVKGLIRRQLLVGLLLENRPNLGGETLCVTGGFTEPGETLEQAQQREADEEAGLRGRVRSVGNPAVTDRLFWNASEPGWGTNTTFVQKISPRSLRKTGQGEWRLKEGTQSLKNFKRAQSLVFLEWGDAVDTCRDGIALAALANVRRAYDKQLL